MRKSNKLPKSVVCRTWKTTIFAIYNVTPELDMDKNNSIGRTK